MPTNQTVIVELRSFRSNNGSSPTATAINHD